MHWYTPFIFFVRQKGLLALMTILAQSLLTLVSSHLVALLLFSVWHSLMKLFYCLTICKNPIR